MRFHRKVKMLGGRFVSELIKKDEYYRGWIQSISKAFRKSQLKVAVKVNDQMLQFYWILGRDIASMNRTSLYGTDFYNNVSKDLTELLLDVKSFSVTNLRYMVWFYELYPNVLNLPQAGVEFETPILRIPWGHNKFLKQGVVKPLGGQFQVDICRWI